MALSNSRKIQVIETLKQCLRQKFFNYKPETENMPFHYRLLGKDKMALFSFIQSLNTTFGISIYEPVAKEIAKENFKEVYTQYELGKTITDEAQKVIQDIMNNLSIGGEVNKLEETKRIREVSRLGKEKKL